MAKGTNAGREAGGGLPIAERVALVTGGSRGIGQAIALRLAELGARVAICGRDADALAGTLRELQSLRGRAHAQRADVTRAEEVAALVSGTESALGPISVLVNNAGIGIFGPVQDRTEEEWDAVLSTNLKSVFLVSRAVIPGMIGRKGGDIVNVGSLAGRNAFAGGAIYCASKWGLLGLTTCMAEDLRQFNIRVSSILPGSVATDFGPRAGAKNASNALAPEDVAHAVAMVLTQGAQSFISEVQLRPLRKS